LARSETAGARPDEDGWSVERYYRLPRSQVALFDMLIEGYEGMAVPATVDRKVAIMRVTIPVGFAADFDRLAANLGDPDGEGLDLVPLTDEEAAPYRSVETAPRAPSAGTSKQTKTS